MPYGIKKVKGGFKVYNKDTGKTYSKKPHKTREKAFKQQAAMYVNASPEGEGNNKEEPKKPIEEGFGRLVNIILNIL